MRAIFAPMTVNDYCLALNANTIVVNEDYQRNSGLWTSHSKSFFIESVILEYPIPKLFLYASTDLQTRKTTKEIVDGQQRSDALKRFYNGNATLSSRLETAELRGRKYRQLEDDHQSAFLNYQLPIDQFSGVADSEVRESFRRMNASNVPLNDEEQRNARFHGPFKWFIQALGREYSERFFKLTIFSKRDLIRMADAKMLADIAYALDVGIATTKGPQLDALYRRHNASFDETHPIAINMKRGIDQYLASEQFHVKEFVKPHIVQSIIEIMVDRLSPSNIITSATALQPDVARRLSQESFTLDQLRTSLADPEDYPELNEFSDSTLRGTNVGAARAARILYFNQAM